MTSYADRDFWRAFARLPKEVRNQATEAFEQFSVNPFYRSLHFKPVRGQRDVWSARVSENYRVVGLRDGDEITWTWIGTHAEYDKLF